MDESILAVQSRTGTANIAILVFKSGQGTLIGNKQFETSVVQWLRRISAVSHCGCQTEGGGWEMQGQDSEETLYIVGLVNIKRSNHCNADIAWMQIVHRFYLQEDY